MSENCYVYWDEESDDPNKKRYVYMQCVECYAKNKKGVMWPAVMGYKNRVVCGCGKVIHEGESDE